MHKKFCTLLLLGVWMAAGPRLMAQARHSKPHLDVALTWDGMHSNTVGSGSFWMQGAGFQFQDRFWRGLGVVADIAGTEAGNIHSTGAGLNLLTVTFGPRWTWSHRRLSIYGQGLVGQAFGFDGIFPAPRGVNTSDNSLAANAGGGINLALRRHLALRLLEAGWVHTQLPNAAGNTQNDLRLSAGIVLSFR